MNTLNSKVILLSGFARGGTNIAWNLLQSHPEICSSIRETGQIMDENRTPKFVHRLRGRLGSGLILDRFLFKLKMQNLVHNENKYRSESTVYSRDEVERAALCLKSVNEDLHYTETLLRVYPDLYFIGLIRNGYALCDGYIRRGMPASYAARIYTEFADAIKNHEQKVRHFKLIRFEDILRDPFGVSETMFEFVEADPVRLDKLRLKSKNVIRESGEHEPNFGEQGHKYWFDRSTIGSILDDDINSTQLNRLSPDVVHEFNREAGGALTYFGYEILDPDSL